MKDGNTTEELFDELVRIGLVKVAREEGEGDDKVVMGKVDKERIRELSIN